MKPLTELARGNIFSLYIKCPFSLWLQYMIKNSTKMEYVHNISALIKHGKKIMVLKGKFKISYSGTTSVASW